MTICTQNRKEYLSEIVNRKIELLPAGNIVEKEWIKTESLRKNVRLDEYVIIPNHFHANIYIVRKILIMVEPPRRGVSTNTLKPNSLGSIIGQFKSVSSKIIRQTCVPEFSWQSRFYDHIIRTEKSLFEVRKYIRNNHLKWESDEENPNFI